MCGIVGIFYLAVIGLVFIGPWFVKEWQSPHNEGKAIIFIVIYYVGSITIGRFIFKIIDEASQCYLLDF